MLVERFSGRLYSLLLRRVGSREDAEDLTQETFVRAWSRLETYKPHLRFSTWLFTIAVRLAAAHYRRARPRRELSGQEAEDRAGREGGPAAAAAAGESRSRLWALAEQRLTPDQFSAVWLRYVEDAPVEDIARIMGKSRVGIRVTLFRARERLAGSLGALESGGDVQESAAGDGVPVLRVRARRERVGGAV